MFPFCFEVFSVFFHFCVITQRGHVMRSIDAKYEWLHLSIAIDCFSGIKLPSSNNIALPSISTNKAQPDTGMESYAVCLRSKMTKIPFLQLDHIYY